MKISKLSTYKDYITVAQGASVETVMTLLNFTVKPWMNALDHNSDREITSIMKVFGPRNELSSIPLAFNAYQKGGKRRLGAKTGYCVTFLLCHWHESSVEARTMGDGWLQGCRRDDMVEGK